MVICRNDGGDGSRTGHEGELFERFAPAGERFYHADSNLKNHIQSLVKIGVSALNIGPMVSAGHIYRTAPDMTVVGQVPPTQTLWLGSPDDVVDAVRQDVRDAMAAVRRPGDNATPQQPSSSH